MSGLSSAEYTFGLKRKRASPDPPSDGCERERGRDDSERCETLDHGGIDAQMHRQERVQLAFSSKSHRPLTSWSRQIAAHQPLSFARSKGGARSLPGRPCEDAADGLASRALAR